MCTRCVVWQLVDTCIDSQDTWVINTVRTEQIWLIVGDDNFKRIYLEENTCVFTGPLWGETTGHRWNPFTKY